MTEPLSRDRIIALYAAFGEAAFPGWDAWLASYTTHLQWADKLDAAALRVPESQ